MTEEVKAIPVTKTICRDCVFNTFFAVAHDEYGDKHWCSVGKLDNNKAEWNEKDQYWSLDYFCNHCRNSDWVKKNKLEYAPDSALLEKIREENTVFTDIIILVHQHHLLEDVKRVLDKIQSKYIGKVIVSVNNQKIKPSAINRLLSEYKFDWQILMHLEDTSVDDQVHKVHKFTKGMFFMLVDMLGQYNDDLPKQIDIMINDNNNKFVYYEPDENMVNIVMHNILYQMLRTVKRDVIIKYAEDQQCLHMLKLKN